MQTRVKVTGHLELVASTGKSKCSICDFVIKPYTKYAQIKTRTNLCLSCVRDLAGTVDAYKKSFSIDALRDREIEVGAFRETSMQFRNDIVAELRALGYKVRDIATDTARRRLNDGKRSCTRAIVLGNNWYNPRVVAVIDEFTMETFVTVSRNSVWHHDRPWKPEDACVDRHNFPPVHIPGGDPNAAKTIAKTMKTMQDNFAKHSQAEAKKKKTTPEGREGIVLRPIVIDDTWGIKTKYK